MMTMSENAPLRHNVVRRFHRTAQGRLALSLGVALAGGCVLLTFPLSTANRVLHACNFGIYAMLALTWPNLMRNSPRQTQLRAAANDPGRFWVHLSVLLTTVFCLFAVFLLLREIAQAPHGKGLFWLPSCLAATIGAWLLNHTSWTLRYAHLYYRDHGEGVGGLSFPGDKPPDDWDFAYFAFTIGMCFQVSDVTITDKKIRRAALIHSVQSFGFNTTIIALTLNVLYAVLS